MKGFCFSQRWRLRQKRVIILLEALKSREFLGLLEKLKIDSDKIIKYLNDDMINLLYSVSYRAKHKKTTNLSLVRVRLY